MLQHLVFLCSEVIDINKPCRFLILGYGVSGISTANFLRQKGHDITVFDDNIESTVASLDNMTFDAVIKSPGVPFMPHNIHPIIQKACDYNIPVISNYDVFALYHPEARVIVVTGTNGKSTTTALIHHILTKSGVNATMGGNIGIPYGDLKESDVYIFEMSSYELAISKYMKFDTCCLLNIEPDHLDIHGNFENYIEAKHRGLDAAKTKIISYEDPHTFEKYKNTAITISDRDNRVADVYVKERALIDNNKIVCDLSSFSELRGTHNHQNAAFAYTVCKHLGISPKEIARHMASFKALPHRMNIVRKIDDVLFVNDSKATNPESSAKALDTYVGYKIFWLVGGRSKKTDIHKSIDKFIGSVCKIYLFGESMDEFDYAFRNIKETVRCSTIDRALSLAYADAMQESGPSVVLLSPMCASFDQFENYAKRGEFFINLVKEL